MFSKRLLVGLTVLASTLIGIQSACAADDIRRSFPKDKPPESAKLVGILKAAGVQPLHKNGGYVYRVFDITCGNNSPEPKPKCFYAVKIDGDTKTVQGKAAEELFSFMTGLPVSQGDSGASMAFISCWAGRSSSEPASCQVGIELDYSGP